MDLKALREAAIQATARALFDRNGVSASEDSDEWEEEYRVQFAALKARAGSGAIVTPPPPSATAAAERQWPELSGTPEQKRWAASVREERFEEIKSEPVRAFLTHTWTRAKTWIDTSDVPTAVLLQRLKPQYDEYRKQTAERARARAAEIAAKTAAAAAFQQKLKDAGITPTGLVELIDASERADPAPIAAKLAEIAVDGRALRVFETSDPNLLLIKEKNDRGQHDYGIERDEGLVADLKLYGEAPAA